MPFSLGSYLLGVGTVVGALAFGFGGGLLLTHTAMKESPAGHTRVERLARAESETPAARRVPAAQITPAANRAAAAPTPATIPPMPSPGLRRGLVAAGLLVAAAVAVVVLVLSASGSPHHKHPHVAAKPPAPPPPRPAPVVTDIPWPFYGYNVARTRFFPNSQKLDPPLRRGWIFRDYALLEFPPVIYDNTLYFEDYYAHTKAVSALTGRSIWTLSLIHI